MDVGHADMKGCANICPEIGEEFAQKEEIQKLASIMKDVPIKLGMENNSYRTHGHGAKFKKCSDEGYTS